MIYPTIQTFHDLDVYQRCYQNMLTVMKTIIPQLPKEERFDLVDQMRRACKAPSALIAEGFAKRYQRRQWTKYLRDAMGECYEMINHLSVCKDVYGSFVDSKKCELLIAEYTIVCKQLTSLSQVWTNYHEK